MAPPDTTTPTVARWTADEMPDQRGMTILITGANSGLGLRSAEALAKAGAEVLLACRNPQKAAAALESVKAAATGASPSTISLDLADLSSVRAAAEEVNARSGGIDVLMANAGVMAIPRRATADGFEMQFGTNHLGHFALVGRCLPALARSGAPRVVVVSSMAHRAGKMRWDDLQSERRYSKWLAYGQSKLSNLLFVRELAARAAASGWGLVAAAAHPGYASTHLQAAGPEMAGNAFMARAMGVTNKLFGQSDAAGAWPQEYAATMPDVKSGDYFGPGGFMEQHGNPKRVGMTGRAQNDADARRLWEVSEQLTGVRYEFPAG